MELVTSCRSTVKTKDYSWLCRSSCINALITLIEHSFNTSPTCSSDNNVTYFKSTSAYKHCTYISTALIKRRLNDSTSSLTIRISLQIKHFCLKKHLVQKFINADTLLCTNLLTLIFTTPLFNK